MAAFARHVDLRGHRLLDVGCGNGAYTAILARNFDETVGVDVAPVHVEAFRRAIAGSELEARIRIERMSAENLDLPADHFDLVSAIEVLEHVRDVDLAISEMARVLTPSGRLLVSCPNRWFPVETHRFRFPWSLREYRGPLMPFLPYFPALHRRLATARNFTATELRDLMRRHGLREVAVDWVMPPFEHRRWARRLIKPLADRAERTPLRIFGVSIIGVYAKTPGDAQI